MPIKPRTKIAHVLNMGIEERQIVMLKKILKYFFSCDRQSPVEREISRRLTWRVIMLSVAPLPFLLVLIYFIYFLAMSNHESAIDLYECNVKFARRLKCLEEEVRRLRQKLNHDGGKTTHRNDGITVLPPSGSTSHETNAQHDDQPLEGVINARKQQPTRFITK